MIRRELDGHGRLREGWVREHKFWPSVARIDNTYSDKHLVCPSLPVDPH